MTDDERNTINLFKAGVNLIKTGPDGYPLPDQGLELDFLAKSVLKIDTMFIGHRDLDAEQRSLLNLADATSKWLAELISGRRDPDVAQAWFKARAEVVEFEPF
jgi:hypothetical protein